VCRQGRLGHALLVVAPLVSALSSCQLVLDFTGDVTDGGPRPDSIERPSDGDGGGDGACATTTWYADTDADTFGNPAAAMQGCIAPVGYVADGTDCDDAVATAHPGGVDVCNGADDDCNLVTDDGPCAIGCADGARDGFTDAAIHPRIAGCSGGWSVAGVQLDTAPACDRAGGDDGNNPNGAGCRAVDLCTQGWHVCATPADVAASSGTGTCAGAIPAGAPGLFFVTRQSGPGGAECGAGANDLFGCGNVGLTPAASCAPLDRFSNDLCASLGAPWSCGADGVQEAGNVTKSDATVGGVLCCRDAS
jgi:hypothetical protein